MLPQSHPFPCSCTPISKRIIQMRPQKSNKNIWIDIWWKVLCSCLVHNPQPFKSLISLFLISLHRFLLHHKFYMNIEVFIIYLLCFCWNFFGHIWMVLFEMGACTTTIWNLVKKYLQHPRNMLASWYRKRKSFFQAKLLYDPPCFLFELI